MVDLPLSVCLDAPFMVEVMTRVQQRCGRLRHCCELSVDEMSGLVSQTCCE